jgi:DNA-directed RNA polymerase I and III subunit RPAC1
VGVDASIANALRRVMIAEVPTVAIETVHMWNNTSVMQDEVLAHRLGLVPLNLDPRKLDWRECDPSSFKSNTDICTANPEAPTDKNTYVFDLKVTCSRNPEAAKGETDPALRFINSSVKSSHITWQPVGKQENLWKKYGGPQPGPVNKDILLTKLRPGQVSSRFEVGGAYFQVIDAELHCVKGIGADHAKFSPVGKF